MSSPGSPIYNAVIPLDLIDPHPRNPNEHSEEQLEEIQESLDSYTQYRSVVVYARGNGRFWGVVGHSVMTGAIRRGDSVIRADIIPADWPPDLIEEMMVGDNEHGRNSTAHTGRLAALLQEIQARRGTLSTVGSSQTRLAGLLTQLRRDHSTDFLQGYLEKHAQREEPGDEDYIEIDGSGDNPGYVPDPADVGEVTYPMNFVFTSDQREKVMAAIRAIKVQKHLFTSQDALTAICETWTQAHGA